MELVKLAIEACEIARRAGDAIMEIYREADGELEVDYKSDQSPLTQADRASNRIICEALEQLEPFLPIISEENKAVPYEERARYDHYWLVDPLDGTKEFIKRNGEFTVNIALVHQHRVVMGAVGVPARNELFWAARGEGAFRESAGRRHRLQAASFQMSDPGLRVVCSRSHLNDATRKFVDQLDQPELVARGSALKFLILAEGQAHLYPRLGPTMEWDTAAAQIVLEEAGGRVIDRETNDPLRYNKKNLLNPHFVAYGDLSY